MKLKITLFFLMSLVKSFAQEEVTIEDVYIGKNDQFQEAIIGKGYSFSERVDDFRIDTTDNTFSIYLRDKANGEWLNMQGKFLMYDLDNQKVKWSKKINYDKGGIFDTYGFWFYTKSLKSYALDPDTGTELWEVRSSIYYANRKIGVGLGYNNNFLEDKEILRGINLKTGDYLWERSIDRDYGWNQIATVKDSTVLIVANGLHLINLKSGKGWDFKAKTHEISYPSYLTGICSNLSLDSNHVYFADKNKISCHNLEGVKKWETRIPENLMGRATLFKRDSSLYLINKGYALFDKRTIKHGTPFIAKYERKTGKQLYLYTILFREPILDFFIHVDTIYVMHKSKIVSYYLPTGSTLKEKEITLKKDDLQDFVGNGLYIRTDDSTFQNLSMIDTTNQLVFTKKEKILILNANFDVIKSMDFKDTYVTIGKTDDLIFVRNNNKTTILNKNFKQVGRLDVNADIKKYKNKFYFTKNNHLIEIDVDKIKFRL